MIRKLILLSCLVLLFGLPQNLIAKAAFYRKADMVRMAQVIAVVTINSVESTNTKGTNWTYGEVAYASVEQVLKGELPKDVSLYGGENFICAQCHYSKGKFLVFLKRDGEFLTGSNWYLSIRPITGELIEWYKNDDSLELENKPLYKVLGEVQQLILSDKASGE